MSAMIITRNHGEGFPWVGHHQVLSLSGMEFGCGMSLFSVGCKEYFKDLK
jgi:hypothetical protein